MNDNATSGRSPKYEKVRGYFLRGLWDRRRVRDAVLKNWISAEEYAFITGEVYPAPDVIGGDE